MDGGDNDDSGFHNRNGSVMNCLPSGMNTNSLPLKVSGMSMNSVSMYKSSSGADHFFGSGWDPYVSLSQGENFGVSSLVSHCEFATSPYPVGLENQGLSSTSNLAQYPSDPSFVEVVPKIPSIGSGNFSEMANSFGLHETARIANTGCPANYTPNKENGNERTSTNVAQSFQDCQILEEVAIRPSTDGKTRKRASESSSPSNPNKVPWLI